MTDDYRGAHVLLETGYLAEVVRVVDGRWATLRHLNGEPIPGDRWDVRTLNFLERTYSEVSHD